MHEPAGQALQQLVNVNVFFFEVWFIKILAGVYKNFGWGVCNRQNVIGHKFFSVVLIGQNYTRG